MASIAQLGNMMGGLSNDVPTPSDTPPMGGSGGIGGGGKGLGGGGGSAQDGLGQINSGAATVGQAIGTAQSALGGGGGGAMSPTMYKKGGSVKKSYTNGGKINLGACGVKTASKGKKSSW